MAVTEPSRRGVVLVVDDDPTIRALLRHCLPEWEVVDEVEQPVVYANGVLTLALPRGRHAVEMPAN